MKDTRTYHGITLDIVSAGTERICYIILPEGLKGDSGEWFEKAAERYGVTVVTMSGIDWNDALTPWSADGVFKKAKPFGGDAGLFLKDMKDEILPNVESELGLKCPRRYLAGISLSGLFAVWSAFKCDLFTGIASISGSLWYDGFSEWAESRKPSSSVGKIYLSLGDREKRSKDRRMSTVEEKTSRIADILENNGTTVEYVLEADTTHFSPIVPRLEKAFAALFGDRSTSDIQ